MNQPRMPAGRWGDFGRMFRSIPVIMAAVLMAAPSGCQTVKQQAAPAETAALPAAETAAPEVSPIARLLEATPPPAEAERHMISTANPLATQAGAAILEEGGSAIDAAIAAQMVLNLVEPQSSGIGGGGFLLHYSASSGEMAAYDGRETAPRSANPYMFLDGLGKPRKFYDAAVGGLAVGVPGLLRMLEMAHKEHGRRPWKELFGPAIRLAEEGFVVSARLHRLIDEDKYLKTFAGTRDYFHDDAGKARAAGATLFNRPLAETFRLIAEEGADAFYKGEMAQDIARAVRRAGRNPGGMKADDLSAYKAIKREPVCLLYRLWLVCGMGPPSSGGITTLQILGILRKFDLAEMEPASLEAVHLIAEASRLAFADRDTYIADPAFVPVPTSGMLDPSYLELRAAEISPDKSLGTAVPGMPGAVSGLIFGPGREAGGVSTTHLSVIDGDGNAVSMTSSIENVFGSRLMTNGFLLNNQLTDFSFAPNVDAAPVANRVEAGKRPRSSMSPTLVFDGSGKVVAAVGSPGGSWIIGYVAKTLIAALDWKLNISQAIDLPNFVNRNGPTELERGTPLEALRPALEALGHEVAVKDLNSGLHGVVVTDFGLAGGADKRREGTAMGK